MEEDVPEHILRLRKYVAGAAQAAAAPKPVDVKYRIIGLDLGKVTDPAAAAIGWMGGDRILRVIGTKKWPLGTSYPQLITDVLAQPADIIVPDFSGVGRVWVDFLMQEIFHRKLKIKVSPVQTVTSRATERSHDENGFVYHSMPKLNMAASIERLASEYAPGESAPDGKFRLAFGNVPEKEALLKEMEDYKRANMIGAANNRPNGHHFDLLTALGLMCWWSLRFMIRGLAIYQPDLPREPPGAFTGVTR